MSLGEYVNLAAGYVLCVWVCWLIIKSLRDRPYNKKIRELNEKIAVNLVDQALLRAKHRNLD